MRKKDSEPAALWCHAVFPLLPGGVCRSRDTGQRAGHSRCRRLV
nr:hypothetical protein [Acetivibrio ethanolgignens]